MNDYKVKIIDKTFLTKDIVSMSLELKKEIEIMPGQFLMLEVPHHSLRRPFVIADKEKNIIKIIFKIKGEGTFNLSKLSLNTELMCLMPLGSFFPIIKDKTPVLVAGGIGIVSLIYLYKFLKNNTLIFGASSKEFLIHKNLFSKLLVCTDDGSEGVKCNTVDLLKSFLEKDKKYVIYGCGPNAMLKELSVFTKEKNIETYLSLEERMGCGVGACLACAIKTTEGIKRVCKEGPIFNSKILTWENIN